MRIKSWLKLTMVASVLVGGYVVADEFNFLPSVLKISESGNFEFTFQNTDGVFHRFEVSPDAFSDVPTNPDANTLLATNKCVCFGIGTPTSTCTDKNCDEGVSCGTSMSCRWKAGNRSLVGVGPQVGSVSGETD